uniref:Uncharacterized protein n=1 Tax=Xiphophorus couchianus TaxID=32473 RepID=A0A3B5L2K4_9TELE
KRIWSLAFLKEVINLTYKIPCSFALPFPFHPFVFCFSTHLFFLQLSSQGEEARNIPGQSVTEEQFIDDDGNLVTRKVTIFLPCYSLPANIFHSQETRVGGARKEGSVPDMVTRRRSRERKHRLASKPTAAPGPT